MIEDLLHAYFEHFLDTVV